MENIECILLDLGGVLFQSTGISSAKIDWNIVQTLNHKYGHGLSVGKDLYGTFLKEYNTLTHQSLGEIEFLKEIFDTLEMNVSLVEALQKIAPIIIVSDNYRENILYISERYKFDEWAENQIYSFNYEMEKTHPLFFEKLTKELSDTSPASMLYIDDSPAKIKSASLSGIKGILFKSNEQLFHELDQLKLT